MMALIELFFLLLLHQFQILFFLIFGLPQFLACVFGTLGRFLVVLSVFQVQSDQQTFDRYGFAVLLPWRR